MPAIVRHRRLIAAAVIGLFAVAGSLPFAQHAAADQPSRAAAANPFAPRAGLDDEALVALVLDMLDRPASVRRRPGFSDGLVAACDRLIDSDSRWHRDFGVLARFKALHLASLDEVPAADEKLAEMSAQYLEDSSDKVSAFARFIGMERRLLDAASAPEAELPSLLADLKSYLAEERLTNNHLRMASLTVELINRMPEDEREKLFEEYGKLYARSVDLDLANYGKQLGRDPEEQQGDLIGTKMKLTGTTATGEHFNLDREYQGNVVLVDFWATWCGPCVKELPNVVALYEKERRRGLTVVGVSIDTDSEALRRFLTDTPVPWPTLSGAEARQAAQDYGVRGIPTFFLLDREGKIVARAHRVEQLADQIEALLTRKDDDD